MAKVTDLTAGVYRRVYAGFIGGRRINSVPLKAEAWFWRLQAVCDDFGNAPADQMQMYFATIGRRADVTQAEVWNFYETCIKADLLREYTTSGDPFFHVVDFLIKQPAGKNGKRVRRYPESPWDLAEINAGESRLKQCSDTDTDTDTDTETHSEKDSGEPDKPASPLMVFPVVGDKNRNWDLTESYLSQLSENFPGTDVLAECRHAAAWCQANVGRRKTARGMNKFLTDWIIRSRQRPDPKSNGNLRNETPEEYGRRMSAKIGEKERRDAERKAAQ